MLAGGGFYIYVQIGFNKFIPGPYISGFHKTIGTILMIFCYWTFYMASVTDPGVIKKSNLKQSLRKYDYDGVMFKKN